MARSVLDRPTSLCAATSKHPETAATELSIEMIVQNKKKAFASVRSPARANSSAMSYIKFLLCTLAVALLSPAAAIGLGSNFKDVNCTGSIQVVRNQQVIPVNFWDIDQSASPFTFHDPEWLNAAMNSTTVPITDGAIEFGFGRIASKLSSLAQCTGPHVPTGNCCCLGQPCHVRTAAAQYNTFVSQIRSSAQSAQHASLTSVSADCYSDVALGSKLV